MAGHGINVQACMRALFDRFILGRAATPSPVRLSNDPGDFGGGSVNMRQHFTVCNLVWAPAKLAAIAVKRMEELLRREELAHGGAEPLSASHGQLTTGAFGAALLHTSRLGQDASVSRLIDWFRAEYAVYCVAELPSGDPWLPGGRGFKGKGDDRKILGTNPARVELMTAVRTGRVKSKPNQYILGPLCVARLPDEIRAQIITWPSEFPPMWRAFHAARYEGMDDAGSEARVEFHAYFEPPHWKDAVMAAGYRESATWIEEDWPGTGDELRDAVHAARVRSQDDKRAPTLVIDAPAARIDDKSRLIE